jgi:hypothetical protein
MQNPLTQLKQRLLNWLLSLQDVTAVELFNASDRVKGEVNIPGPDGKTKFIGLGYTDKLVLTPAGYVPIKRALRTVDYQPYKLTLSNDMHLVAADEHLVITDEGQKQVMDLLPGDRVLTKDGLAQVESVVKWGTPECMYDFEINHPDHVYYTNGILSHNTTVIAAYLLWFACFHFEKYILVASKDNDAALDVMGRIRFGYEELPFWLKPGCLYFNRHEISFDNNSTIKSSATTENTGRGRSVSLLMLDELAFVKREIQMAMWASLAPTLSTGGSCIISSTPNGDQDLFAKLWREAEMGVNTFKTVFAPWSEHPERDERYKAEMIGKVGEVMFRQEYASMIASTEITVMIDDVERVMTIGELYELMLVSGNTVSI